MTVQAEGMYLNEVLKWELENNQSREIVTIKAGKALKMGAVLGKITIVSPIPTTGTAGTNTGNGTCTAVTRGDKTRAGIYTLTCKTKVAGAGVFAVQTPTGATLADATVAVAYVSDHINFTLNDGTPDFEVGDKFTVTVAAGTGAVIEYTPGATDGSQVAYGVLIADADTASVSLDGVAIVRDAQVVADNLVFGDAVTAGQIATAIVTFYDKGIVTREQA